MHRAPALFLILLFTLSGCSTLSSTDEHQGQCLNRACLAHPASNDYQYILDNYGLHQITDDSEDPGRAQIEGDLVVWQRSSVNLTDVSGFYGYRFSTNSLFEIADSPEYHRTRGLLSEGRMVFTQKPWTPSAEDYPGGSYLMLWDSRDDTLRRLPIPLNGSQDSFAFEGSWVVFGNRFSQNASENALWAFNVNDERLIHLYTPPPNRKLPDGSYEGLSGRSVDHGIAYYIVFKTNKEKTHTNDTLYAHNLETGEIKVKYEGSGPFSVDIDVSAPHMAYAVNNGAYYYNLIDNETSPIRFDESRPFFSLAVSDRYIAMGYRDIEREVFGFSVFNVTTFEETVLFELQGEMNLVFAPVEWSLSDDRVLISINRGSDTVFESGNEDLYWMYLPHVHPEKDQ